MSEREQAYVFKPMKQRLQVLALGGREWAVVVLVAAAGAALAFALGFWTHIEQVDVAQTQITNQQSALREERTAAKKAARADAAAARGDKSSSSALSTKDRELADQATADGITAETTDEEIAAMVPTTELAPRPVIPDIPRWMLFFFAPALAAAALQAELFHNSSIARELERACRNAAAQHRFESAPQRYMEAHEERLV